MNNHKMRRGMKIEVVNKMCVSGMRVAVICDIVGGRLRLNYVDSKVSMWLGGVVACVHKCVCVCVGEGLQKGILFFFKPVLLINPIMRKVTEVNKLPCEVNGIIGLISRTGITHTIGT